MYHVGSIAIGLLMVLDNLSILNRGGRLNVDSKGSAIGFTKFSMVTQMGWFGYCIVMVMNGIAQNYLPHVFIFYVVLSLVLSLFLRNSSNVLDSIPKWLSIVYLVISVVYLSYAFITAYK